MQSVLTVILKIYFCLMQLKIRFFFIAYKKICILFYYLNYLIKKIILFLYFKVKKKELNKRKLREWRQFCA